MDLIRRHFTLIDSTNTWAKQHAEELPFDKITLVTADAQTAGRGRFKRQWESPPNQNIYASFCFFIKKRRPDIGNIPQILALSCADILETLGFSPELKWPNDILLSKKKVAGILAETTSTENGLCVVIGIGLNVNMPLDILQRIDRPATSLAVERGCPFDVETVLNLLANKFSVDLDVFLNQGFVPFLNPYKKRISEQENRAVRFHDNNIVWSGTIERIENDGSLSLKLPDGSIKNFIVGEILF
ncbi:MAG: biotin--[acetyl-CoA-carboxylase] ligase [Parachlamydiaceae bacterium]